jgi:hypothetical protein
MSVAPARSVWDDQNDILSKTYRITGRSVWEDNYDTILNKSQSSNKTIWKPFLVGLLISLLIGSIVVAAVIVLWVLVK